jgi:hypothetical protein
VSRLSVGGGINLLPLYAFMIWTGKISTLTLGVIQVGFFNYVDRFQSSTDAECM